MAQERINVPYGRRTACFAPPPGVKTVLLHSKAAPTLGDPAAAAEKAVRTPLATRPLEKLAAGAKTAAIVVSDFTRPVPNRAILPPIFAALERAGLPRGGITVIIATGTHRAAPPDEIRAIVGARIARTYRIVNHDCRRGNKRVGFISNPLTGRELPVILNREYVAADLRIVTGLVEPHIFCGYSGGRKAVLPGVAALTSIRAWHGPELIAHRASVPGIVKGNLSHGLSRRAFQLAPADFAVNVTLDRQRRPTGIFAGAPDRVFRAAVARVESYVLTRPVEPAKVVVTSGGGWPLDATFYQAIKGLAAVLPVLAPGGVVVLAAGAGEGIGDSAFTRLVMTTGDITAWARGLSGRKRLATGQWQLQRMARVCRRGCVFLVSTLSTAQAQAAFTRPFASLQAAVEAALRRTGADRVVVVPEGPYVVTRGLANRPGAFKKDAGGSP